MEWSEHQRGEENSRVLWSCDLQLMKERATCSIRSKALFVSGERKLQNGLEMWNRCFALPFGYRVTRSTLSAEGDFNINDFELRLQHRFHFIHEIAWDSIRWIEKVGQWLSMVIIYRRIFFFLLLWYINRLSTSLILHCITNKLCWSSSQFILQQKLFIFYYINYWWYDEDQ